MTIQTLPSYAQVVFDGYSETLDPPLQRTEFDDGYVRQASTVSRRRVIRACTLRLCSTQELRDFKCWVRDNLSNGARWFNMYDPVEGRTLRCRFVDGAFKFTPRAQVNGAAVTVWTADCQIESWY